MSTAGDVRHTDDAQAGILTMLVCGNGGARQDCHGCRRPTDQLGRADLANCRARPPTEVRRMLVRTTARWHTVCVPAHGMGAAKQTT